MLFSRIRYWCITIQQESFEGENLQILRFYGYLWTSKFSLPIWRHGVLQRYNLLSTKAFTNSRNFSPVKVSRYTVLDKWSKSNNVGFKTLAQTGLSITRIWWWCQNNVTEDGNWPMWCCMAVVLALWLMSPFHLQTVPTQSAATHWMCPLWDQPTTLYLWQLWM